MSVWLDQITATDDLAPILEAYVHFDTEYERVQPELDVKGKILVEVGARVPGLSEYVHAQWSHLNAIVDIIEMRMLAEIQKSRKHYTESYTKALGVQQVEHYAKADPNVSALTEVLVRMKYQVSLWEGLSKGVERLHQQIRIIGDVRKAGMDDMTI